MPVGETGGVQQLSMVSLLVPDQDEAIAFFVGVMGFDLVEDSDLGEGRRWVVVGPPGGTGALLLLAKADGSQADTIGRQGGGRVWLFLHTDDFESDHRRLSAAGVRFLETPRREAYGTVAVFEDCYGNRWDLLEPAAPT